MLYANYTSILKSKKEKRKEKKETPPTKEKQKSHKCQAKLVSF